MGVIRNMRQLLDPISHNTYLIIWGCDVDYNVTFKLPITFTHLFEFVSLF